MRIIFYGGRMAGTISLLTLIALGHKVVCVIPVDSPVERTAKNLKLNVKNPKDINSKRFVNYLKSLKPDYFICCHGRKILKKEMLSAGVPAFNLHPCLYKYPGADPISRMLKDGINKASVASHWMVEKVDRGEVIVEKFQEVRGKSAIEVYNELYPLYAEVLIETFKKMNVASSTKRK
ncbi:MAG: formyltransferase family protein [Candidatus Pacebacteria bacterium]|nr:formyltransferase family protein [Candidatus Paceibacterota bacterium]